MSPTMILMYTYVFIEENTEFSEKAPGRKKSLEDKDGSRDHEV